MPPKSARCTDQDAVWSGGRAVRQVGHCLSVFKNWSVKTYALLVAVGAAVTRGSVSSHWRFNTQHVSFEFGRALENYPKIAVVLGDRLGGPVVSVPPASLSPPSACIRIRTTSHGPASSPDTAPSTSPAAGEAVQDQY